MFGHPRIYFGEFEWLSEHIEEPQHLISTVACIHRINRQNPDTVVNNFDAPNFRTFSGGQGRAVTLRVRFIGRK